MKWCVSKWQERGRKMCIKTYSSCRILKSYSGIQVSVKCYISCGKYYKFDRLNTVKCDRFKRFNVGLRQSCWRVGLCESTCSLPWNNNAMNDVRFVSSKMIDVGGGGGWIGALGEGTSVTLKGPCHGDHSSGIPVLPQTKDPTLDSAILTMRIDHILWYSPVSKMNSTAVKPGRTAYSLNRKDLFGSNKLVTLYSF